MTLLTELAERRLLPDAVIRLGVRRLLRDRLRSEWARARRTLDDRRAELRRQFASGPVAEATDASRQQHYEAPTELFQAMLGPRLKYSCCLWEDGAHTLADAEEAMLRLTARRAGVADGQRILDLGCGWGSFALWAAERFPHTEIVAVSHSRTQHDHLVAETQHRGLTNLRHIVADASHPRFAVALADEGPFDRIVSIEMFEHLRNVERLLEQMAPLVAPSGQLFVHIFCHRELFYRYRDEGPGDWMARHFFSGGAMPPFDLFDHVGGPFKLLQRWEISGADYARTCLAWLRNLDSGRPAVVERLSRDLPPAEAQRQWQRWRMFLIACQELFAHDRGRQWLVSHHLLAPR
jgi:cyclopropane-fatty-acyl-phospholipid synthase